MTGVLLRIGVGMQKCMWVRRPREARGRHDAATSRGNQGSRGTRVNFNQQKLTDKKGSSLWRECGSADTLISAYVFLNCEKRNFWCVKLPDLR